jgi:hypothetical protein
VATCQPPPPGFINSVADEGGGPVPTWREVAAVAASTRAERFAEYEAWLARTDHDRADTTVAVVLAYKFADLDHPDPHGGFGTGDRGAALTIAHRLSQLEAERATISGATPSSASDDRRRTARLRALDTEADTLGTQLQACTSSWWPDKPAAGRTAARQAAQTGVTAPGPAPRVFLPR